MNAKKAIVLIFYFLFFLPGPDAKGMESISCTIQEILTGARESDGLWIGCEQIHASRELINFYALRGFSPIWVDEYGPSALALQLPGTLATANLHGLRADDYHYSCIVEWIKMIDSQSKDGKPITNRELADLDIVMTDAFVNYGSHLANGKVDPEHIYPHWRIKRHKSDIFEVLDELSFGGSVDEAIKKVATVQPDYWELIEQAKRLDALEKAGGWPTIPEGKTLHPGDRDPRILPLRQRLEISGFLPHGPAADEKYYDRGLSEAVKKFQACHGLEQDGVVGENTLAALNVSAGSRREQILVNLERRRWLPSDFGSCYILVNIAAYSLEAVNQGEEKLSMRVIVGEAYKKTPVFSKNMKYLVINPYWNVPRGIVIKELLPKIKENMNYIAENNYELVAGWDQNSPPVDYTLIDWAKINSTNFPGRLRQLPGPGNALGRIKFIFPNKFDIYLHDTPSRNLFKKAKRAMSHGCIRVEKPLELALFVLRDAPEWTRERIEKIIESKKEQVVGLPSPCTVYIVYLTTWIDSETGEIQFRSDIYDRDRVLWDALQKTPPGGEIPPDLIPEGENAGLLPPFPRKITSSDRAPHPGE